MLNWIVKNIVFGDYYQGDDCYEYQCCYVGDVQVELFFGCQCLQFFIMIVLLLVQLWFDQFIGDQFVDECQNDY